MRNRFFFLAGTQLEIHTAVVVLAEFTLQHGDEFFEPLPVPRHDFREE